MRIIDILLLFMSFEYITNCLYFILIEWISRLGSHLLLNNIEIISIVALTNDHIIRLRYFLKHSVENLVHLLNAPSESDEGGKHVNVET